MSEKTSFQIENPAVTSSDYDYMVPYWEMHDDVIGGTRTMREAGEKYLDRYEAETKKSWNLRLKRTTLYNVLADSIENVVSRPFSKPLHIGEGADKKITDWSKDIDTCGTSLHNFAARSFRRSAEKGLAFILADYPMVEEGTTLAQKREKNIRPWLVDIPAQSVIGIYKEMLNNREIVSHFRFVETRVRLNKQTLQEEIVEVVKIIEPDLWQLYERVVSVRKKGAKKGEARGTKWELKKHGIYTFGEVPVSVLAIGDPQGEFSIKPAFTDLTYKNIEHWQSSSDQRNILTKSRFAMLAASGLRQEDFKTDEKSGKPYLDFGPDSLLITSDPNGRFYYAEISGQSIKAGAEDLAILVEQMRVMGIEPLMQRDSGVITATESAIDEAKSQSRLHKWTYDAENATEKALNFMAKWEDIESDVQVELNREFGVIGNKDDVKLLWEMRQNREISKQTFFGELKRRGFFNDVIDSEEEQQKIDQEPPDFVDLRPSKIAA